MTRSGVETRGRTGPRALLALLPWLALLAACGPTPPNVLVIVLDTLRADHVGAYGYPRDTTPNLDRVISQGARFDAAIAPSSWSAPSHLSITTGLQPTRHHVFHWGHRVPDSVVTLAERLAAAGFGTGLFTSHGGLRHGVANFHRGFGEHFGKSRDDDPEVLDAAATWIDAQAEPWYAHVILMSMHGHYDQYPPEWNEQVFTDVPPGGERTFPFLESKFDGTGGIPSYLRMGDHQDAGEYVNRYDRALRRVDALLGAFFARLAEAGVLDDTLVVLTADHGESLGDHDHFGHGGLLYDHLVRVPLALRLPGRVPAGATWSDPVELADIVPTVLGFVGLPPADGLDGIDLSGHLERGTRPPPRLVTSAWHHEGRWCFMVRSARHKLMRDTEGERTSLYDLERDPREREDLLAAGRAPAEVLAPLRERLQALVADYQAVPVEEPEVLSAEAQEALRALGYLEPAAADAPRAAP